MTNESALLGLLADLYKRIAALDAENQQLRAALAANQPTATGGDPAATAP